MILDTTFLVDVLRGSESVADLVEEIDRTGAPFVSSITVMELSEGIRRSDASTAERAAVEDLLTDIEKFPFDHDCATRAGELLVELEQAGEPAETTDAMIAATALVHDHAVVTRNVDHFERVDGLEVLTY